MNDDYPDLSSARYEQPPVYPGGTGTGRHSDPADALCEQGWDPVEELTYLLQDAAAAEQEATVPPPRSEPSYSGEFISEPMDNLAQNTAELPPLWHFSTGHRKARVRKSRLRWVQTVSFVIAAFAAVIVSMVSVFGGMVAYAPLRHIASAARSGSGPWWPLLVYGPWMVASLSVLRAALHQRRAEHSWYVVLLFSFVVVMFCVADAHKTITGVAAAVVPALASLTCFQQLVRQITLTRPPRQRSPRH
ncbi:DUF2637 domain-containing protein [Streptomyces sp. NBC_01715]|uniref:DUF2637 domain-containing protein n=1 Tax=Streptomyces sp. NBC_01715 TaxID=2975916 RepID=UPI002E36C83C|nr:DUF2637 domain-containing protein [Streptomyces sp. NBC_01715]